MELIVDSHLKCVICELVKLMLLIIIMPENILYVIVFFVYMCSMMHTKNTMTVLPKVPVSCKCSSMKLLS